MVVQALNANTQEAELGVGSLWVWGQYLIYRASSRATRATQPNPYEKKAQGK